MPLDDFGIEGAGHEIVLITIGAVGKGWKANKPIPTFEHVGADDALDFRFLGEDVLHSRRLVEILGRGLQPGKFHALQVFDHCLWRVDQHSIAHNLLRAGGGVTAAHRSQTPGCRW